MEITKVVRVSDMKDLHHNKAFRTPGVLVWGNVHDQISRSNYRAGSHFGHAKTISEAKKQLENLPDQHKEAINRIINNCSEYGVYLSYSKALKEYANNGGVFSGYTHSSEMNGLKRILRAILHREIWYRYSKSCTKMSEAHRIAEDESFSWHGVLGQYKFMTILGVSPAMAKFLEKQPLLDDYDFSINNPLFEEKNLI